MGMPGTFGTELNQVNVTAAKTNDAVDVIYSHLQQIKKAIEDLGNWNGQAKEEFLRVMGINVPELENLNVKLQQMGGNLTTLGQGVEVRESDATKGIASIINI